MQYVTKKDNELEKLVLRSVRDQVPALAGIRFVQSPKKTALYDFRGYDGDRVTAGLDVKVRNIDPDQYPTYIISTDKIDIIGKYPNISFFCIYYFKDYKVARVYDLKSIDLRLKKNYNYRHKRANERMQKPVYLVPADQYLAEISI